MTTFTFILPNGLPISLKAEDRDVAVFKLQRMGWKVR